MRSRPMLTVALAVALALSLGQPAKSAEATGEKTDAFATFRKAEMTKYRKFIGQLRENKVEADKRKEKMTAFGKEMLSRYETFAHSEEGKPHALNVRKEIIAIAVQLVGDDGPVDEAIAAEKDPKAVCELKLHASAQYSRRDPARAKSLLQDVMEATRGKPVDLDVRKEILAVAIQLASDDETVDEIVAAAKDFRAVCELKLYAVEQYSRRNPARAKSLLQDLMKATQGKDQKLHEEAKKAQFQVAPEGLVFPEFAEGTKDTEDKPLRIADYKGKVVLVDFWASWCGPCIVEAPNVVRAYKEFHPKGFEIIGISLDSSKDKMDAAIKKYQLDWRHYFDGLGWESKVGRAYGVGSIPATYLVGKDGKIIAHGLRGDALDKKLAEVLD